MPLRCAPSRPVSRNWPGWIHPNEGFPYRNRAGAGDRRLALRADAGGDEAVDGASEVGSDAAFPGGRAGGRHDRGLIGVVAPASGDLTSAVHGLCPLAYVFPAKGGRRNPEPKAGSAGASPRTEASPIMQFSGIPGSGGRSHGTGGLRRPRPPAFVCGDNR